MALNRAHLADTILAPQKFADVPLFHVPLGPQPGKPIVIMAPAETMTAGGLHLLPAGYGDGDHDHDPGFEAKQPDFGVLVAFKARHDSEGRITHQVDRDLIAEFNRAKAERRQLLVAIKPYTGVWYNSLDFDWIPEGRIVKILGNVDPWDKNLLAVVDR